MLGARSFEFEAHPNDDYYGIMHLTSDASSSLMDVSLACALSKTPPSPSPPPVSPHAPRSHGHFPGKTAKFGAVLQFGVFFGCFWDFCFAHSVGPRRRKVGAVGAPLGGKFGGTNLRVDTGFP